jgi:hypothetical protein
MSKLLVIAAVLASPVLAVADDTLQPPSMTPVTVPAQAMQPIEWGDETPPISGTRLAGEALLGGLFAVGGALGGAAVGYHLETAGECGGEFCGLGGIVLGGVTGLAFVTPVGVYLAGSHSGETGSFGATLGGSIVGTLAGIGAAAASQEEGPAAVLIVAGPVVGSMIGFNLTRKYDRPRKSSRLIVPVASATSERTTFGLAGSF